ncbi:hypothetical protein ACIGBH_21940 [Streptomyces sp. NPDC085929]|uniref:hypothetical protein n=1 Tax=Streptomyces sp. NPDC085929 TaxID=3365739 RepID=UPI0037D14FF2
MNSSRHGCEVSTRNDSSPRTELDHRAVPVHLPAALLRAGQRELRPAPTEPAWWVTRTPITSSAGDQQSTCRSALLSMPPRLRTCFTGA